MDVAQKKNITLTVIATILFMITVLALFFNKITTPRYLSDIELKINGLKLIKPALPWERSGDERWILLTHNADQEKLVMILLESLPRKIALKTSVASNIVVENDLGTDVILIAKPAEGIIAYFTAPFDNNKMKLTYASLFTHR